MTRHYRTARPWERDARQEAARRTRDATRMAGPAPEPRDDAREPWALSIAGHAWEVMPDKRHVRRWWLRDAATGEPVRRADGVIWRAGVGELVAWASLVVPRHVAGMRHLVG